ncbi:MAG: DUF1917 domain-containing protein, partial [Burkholderiales bacterium]|nr:DUF1917 domain-containing protein [Anaerolineae bacterium]
MSDKPDPRDLIDMVQRARMQFDSTAKPSQMGGVYWIEAKPQIAQPQMPTSRHGQWVIPTNLDAVDDLWARIKAATEAGELGYKSKVSTSARAGQKRSTDRAIIVCTYDHADDADVQRVREALQYFGITEEI